MSRELGDSRHLLVLMVAPAGEPSRSFVQWGAAP